jgi:hypothetical protein
MVETLRSRTMTRQYSDTHIHFLSATKVLALLIASNTANAETSGFDSLAEMVKGGTASVDLRYRYEGVDQDGVEKNADASTLRSRLTLTTTTLRGFSAQLEFDNITSVLTDNYNSTTNGNTEYPIVADPEATDFNQAWLAYDADKWNAKFGRQRIINASQRFVGGVAWRQNEQTYDGLRIQLNPTQSLSVDASYVYNINRIFGPNDGAQPADWEGDNIFLRATYNLAEAHSVSGYGYLIDVDPQSGYTAGKTVNNSTNTFGIEYQGKFSEWLGVKAAFATQSSEGNSELDYDADYYMAELNASFKPVTLKIGYEVLGSGENGNTGGGVGFKTPLATLHLFQGWADKFLATPANGIEDAYVGISGKLGPVKVGAFYHDFKAESLDTQYGTEFDMIATWPVNKQLSLQAKFADYQAKDFLTDTTKFWLTVQLKL